MNRPSSLGGPAFAVLRVPDFSLHACLRLRPPGGNGAVALLTGHQRKATITALTAAAMAAGVERGFTAPLAQARCPGLILLTPDPTAEQEARAALITVGFSLSPAVEDTGPGVCTVDLAGRPAAEHESALHDAVHTLNRLGLPATAGLAATPLLALYAARETTSVEVVRSPRHFLSRLPLAAAEPPPELLPVLSGWGLRTLEDLTALPKAEVARRLGPSGLALWERAAGEVTRPLHRTIAAPVFCATLDFEHEIETLAPLTFALRRSLDRLCAGLATAGYSATELALELRLSDETRHERTLQLPEPTGDADILFRTLCTHLESLQTHAAVTGFSLTLTPARIPVRQQDLFETGLKDPHGFAETLARIAAVVGANRSGTPRREDTHRPDAVALESPVPVVPPAQPAPAPPRFVLGPPLRRFRPPVPALVELAGDHPAFVRTVSLQGAVTAASGPWMGSGDWWRPDLAWQREEWDVRLDSGGLYRVTRTEAGWFIEGEYD